MSLSFSTLRKSLLALAALIALTLLSLWLALPAIVQSQVEKLVAERTGHRLVMERPEFDPFALALRLARLQLKTPEGAPLLTFDRLLVDLSGASLTRRALVFDAIRIEGLAVTLVELPEGRTNWTPFIEALKGKEARTEGQAGLPRMEIRHLLLAGGKVDYTDRRRTAEGFAARIEPLDLELTDLSTLAAGDGKYTVSARTSIGARIELAGRIDLDPLRASGHFSLADVPLARLAPYLRQLPAPPEGRLALSADFRAGNEDGRFDANLERLQARLDGLRLTLGEMAGPQARIGAIRIEDGRFTLADQTLNIAALVAQEGELALPGIEHPPRLGVLRLEDVRIALSERHARIGSVRLSDARVRAVRLADGTIDLLRAIKHSLGSREPLEKTAGTTAKETVSPWTYQVDALDVAASALVLRDDGLTPPLELALDNLSARVGGISQDLNVPLPVKLSFDVAGGGQFEAAGRVVPATAAAEVDLRLAGLSLKPVQPYLATRTTLTLADGTLSAQGHLVYDEKGPHLKAQFALRDLRLLEPGESQPLLSWKSLDSRDLHLTRQALELGELRLAELTTRLLIDKDKNVNFKRVLKSPGAQPVAPGPPADVAAPAFAINIDRLRLHQGRLDFADESLVLPFATRIHELKGSIAGLSNRPGAVGQVELDGTVDEYGMARAVGQIELANPTNGLDLRVLFRNIEMTRLTPYVATFAGRRIESGRLSLDLEYKIMQRQLTGENRAIMDRLTLGERVESPAAKDLPLDLAVALLQDADGRIDLGLPVSGSLDDPEFSYGALVWKAIGNVLTKIVTAPFRALGALFGGSESIDNIVFEAGRSRLTPPEREKVVKLAEAMAKRPGLILSIGGMHVEADRDALQDVQLRRAVLQQAGQQVPEHGDPGPISTQQPKIREALEALYKERFGAADLAALKEGFRAANPGQLEEGMAGKLVSRLTGLLREKKTLSESEIEALKGADFHALLFERLRAKENIPAERLQALAQLRAEHVAALLRAAGIAGERLLLLAPERGKIDSEPSAQGIPLRLSLEPLKAKE